MDMRTVQLYCCGIEKGWDIELFDASLTRRCPHGCRRLEPRTVNLQTILTCDVCLARVPAGASTMQCQRHCYNVCAYCLGRPCLPAVGDRVVRGPTWPAESPLPEGQDYYEEGIVETGVLDSVESLASISDDVNMASRSYHSHFRVRWLKSGRKSYCRAPPYQDVTPVFANGLTGLKPFTEAGTDLLLTAPLLLSK